MRVPALEVVSVHTRRARERIEPDVDRAHASSKRLINRTIGEHGADVIVTWTDRPEKSGRKGCRSQKRHLSILRQCELTDVSQRDETRVRYGSTTGDEAWNVHFVAKIASAT